MLLEDETFRPHPKDDYSFSLCSRLLLLVDVTILLSSCSSSCLLAHLEFRFRPRLQGLASINLFENANHINARRALDRCGLFYIIACSITSLTHPPCIYNIIGHLRVCDCEFDLGELSRALF